MDPTADRKRRDAGADAGADAAATVRPNSSDALLDGERAALALLVLAAGERRRVRPDGPALVLTLTLPALTVQASGASLLLDRAGCVLLPPGQGATVWARSAGARAAVVTFREAAVAAVARAYGWLGFARDRFARYVAAPSALPRTVWVHELVHRYVFERYAIDAHDNPTTRFLETELLKEVFFLCRDRENGAERATVLRAHGPAVERALAYLEPRLSEPLDVPAVAAQAHVSASTLLRAFRRELGCTPAAYWRARRLEEALALLASGRYSVAEVATRVGYNNPTAFAHAFQQRFGMPPSARRPTKLAKPAP
jgi:AraC-like DNA-binding protein